MVQAGARKAGIRGGEESSHRPACIDATVGLPQFQESLAESKNSRTQGRRVLRGSRWIHEQGSTKEVIPEGESFDGGIMND